MEAYPPGSQTVTISGSITGYPAQTVTHEFTYTLVDPCSSATESIPDIDLCAVGTLETETGDTGTEEITAIVSSTEETSDHVARS